MKQKYFRFPVHFWEAAKFLDQEEREAFYSAVIEYAFTGVIRPLSGKTKLCFDIAWDAYLEKSPLPFEKERG